jgi:hypothetical protein
MLTATVGHDYPTDFPLAEVRRLVGYARGTTSLNVPQAVHDAYHVEGYLLGQTVGEPRPLPVGTAPANAAEALEAWADTHERATVGAFPWQLLLPLVLDLIRQFLAKPS